MENPKRQKKLEVVWFGNTWHLCESGCGIYEEVFPLLVTNNGKQNQAHSTPIDIQ